MTLSSILILIDGYIWDVIHLLQLVFFRALVLVCQSQILLYSLLYSFFSVLETYHLSLPDFCFDFRLQPGCQFITFGKCNEQDDTLIGALINGLSNSDAVYNHVLVGIGIRFGET